MTRDYAGCAARGLTRPETARELGVTIGAVWSAEKKQGLTFRSARNTRRAEYEACADAGMTQTEAAQALGVTRQSMCMAAKRHGLTFRRHVRKDVPKGPLAQLTEAERADYRTLMLHQYTRAEALAAIGRGDLA